MGSSLPRFTARRSRSPYFLPVCQRLAVIVKVFMIAGDSFPAKISAPLNYQNFYCLVFHGHRRNFEFVAAIIERNRRTLIDLLGGFKKT